MEENQSHSTVSSLLVQRLQQQVENNLQNEQFGVEQLAENMGISRSQLHRKLKKSIGQSANQFIREYRLQRALRLLRQDDVTVSEVAFAVGFGSHSYFTTCFTEHFGYPPGEARNRLNEASHDTMAPSSSSEPIQVQVEGVSEPISSAADISIKENSEQKVRKYKQIIMGVAAVMLMSLGYIYYSNSIESETLNISESEIIEKSIAVLPFVNMSNDPDQEALCDGLTLEIIHHLSRIKSFDKVISRSSVMSLKGSDKTLPEIAALLKVNIVLEGSFQQSGDQIKITAQLIDAANDNHLWSEIYERPFGDIFEIQSELAKNIAAKFDVDITKEEEARLSKKPTESSEAYVLLKKGEYKLHSSLKGGIDLIKQAIETDPGLAEGYTALAEAYLLADLSFIGDKSIPVEDPLPLVQEALRLDPELSVGYQMLGSIHHWRDWHFSQAEAEYKKALELEPHNSWFNWYYAAFLVHMGRATEGLPYQEKAVQLDPTNSKLLTALSKVYFYAGNKEKAAEIMEEYESLFQTEDLGGHPGLQYFYLDNLEKAIENFEKVKEYPLYSSFLAIAYTRNGQSQKAQPLVDRLKLISEKKAATSPEYSVGLYYSGIGKKNEALYWLERAYKSHDTELYWLKTEPTFKTLYGDPRYENLLRRIGFPE